MYNYADLADEVLKITGTNNLPKEGLTLQKLESEVDQDRAFNEVKNLMAGMGFTEVQNYSFVSEDEMKKFGSEPHQHLKVKNPLSADQGYLRRNLLIPLLKNIRDNSRYFDAFSLFEVGKGYHGFLDELDLLTFVIYDKTSAKELLLARAKGYVEELVARHRHELVKYSVYKDVLLKISAANVELGNMGIIDPQTMRNFGIEGTVVYAKIDLGKLWNSAVEDKFKAYSKFPEKVLDISMVLEKDSSWGKVAELVKQYGGNLLEDIQVFEADYLYPLGKVPEFHRKLAEKGQKNIAFHMVFRAPDRTLKDSEISPIYDKITGELRSKLNAEIR
jgi:phenylalanyl-tRNA synthetase beta chain